MAVGHLNIIGFKFTFVFRHRFEKNMSLSDSIIMWKSWDIGFFFKKNTLIGRKNFNKPEKWKDNHVTEIMIGFDFLWFKTWFTVSRGAMFFNINKKPLKIKK